MKPQKPVKKLLERVRLIEDQPTVIRTIRGLKDRTIDPRSLSIDDRRAVVCVLSTDGHAVHEMAELLGCSERTIARDIAEIREANALRPDPNLPNRMAGRLVQEAELSISRIRKAIRGVEVAANVKVDGEHRCYLIMSDLVQRLQGLGHLPTAAQKLEAQLSHDVVPGVSFSLFDASVGAARKSRRV